MIFWENERSERYINIIGKVVSNMEIEAYKVQYAYDSNSYPAGASSLKDINANILMNIRREDGTSVYGQLKTGK